MPTVGGSTGNGMLYLVKVHFDDIMSDFDLNTYNSD